LFSGAASAGSRFDSSDCPGLSGACADAAYAVKTQVMYSRKSARRVARRAHGWSGISSIGYFPAARSLSE
jgi:hypothetical protein